MKKAFISLGLLIFGFTCVVNAQNPKDVTEAYSFEKVMEEDAKHNLDVAWQYFKLKKAYKAVLSRTDETLAAHPTFSKIDEIFYLTGMSSYYLSIGKGKQKLNYAALSEDDKKRFAPERLKEDALVYLTMLVEEHPKSKYKKKAEKVLKRIKHSK